MHRLAYDTEGMPSARRLLRQAVLWLALSGAVAGCGQMGPLEPPPEAEAVAASR